MNKTNTFLLIQKHQQEIENIIKMHQEKLTSISSAIESAKQFLLDNGYSEVREDDDILKEVMETIKKMEKQVSIDKEDIKNIKQSIDSLKHIKTSIDNSIILSLEDKVREIEENIESTNEKISDIINKISILLNLQVVCPVCQGKNSIPQTEEQRFNKTTFSDCDYCERAGLLSIEKILIKERIISRPIAKSNTQQFSNSAYESSSANQPFRTYIINRQ